MLMYWKNKAEQLVRSDVGKRVLSTILAVVMLLGLMPTYFTPDASAATAADYPGAIAHNIAGSSLTVSANGQTYMVTELDHGQPDYCKCKYYNHHCIK